MPSWSPSCAPRPCTADVIAAQRTIAQEIAGLQALAVALDAQAEVFRRIVDDVLACRGRVVVTGMGKSGHIARKVAATLASTGTPAFFLHPAEAAHGDLGMVTTADVVLAFSWSGFTAEMRPIESFHRETDVPLYVFTSNPASRIAHHATGAFILPDLPDGAGDIRAPTTSTAMQLAIGDALAMEVMDRRVYVVEDFQASHPGGKLGKNSGLA